MRRVFPLLLLLALLLAGCGTRPLPSGMEEEAVGQAGQEIVEMLVARTIKEWLTPSGRT